MPRVHWHSLSMLCYGQKLALEKEAFMNLTWSHDISNINWVDLAQLYRMAPLGDKDPIRLSTTFQNSRFRCFVFEGDAIVGAGRALSDGHDCSYVCDIAIHPDYQGHGLGKRIVQDLVDQSNGHKKIILYANARAYTI